MSNLPPRPPTLPSYSYQPKVQIQSSTHLGSSKDVNSYVHATASGAASTDSNPLPAMRSRAGSVNTVSSLRTGTQAGSIRRFGDASPPEMPSKTPSHSRSRSGATASHAGGIQPPAAFFRTAPSTPSKSSPHRNMPFRPTKHSRTPTRSAIPVPRRGATHDSRHGTDASDLEFTSRSSGEHDRAPFVPIGLLSATHSDSPATAEQTTAHVFNDSSFSTSQAADASFGTTGPGPLSYRSKPSRDPLLPTLNDQPVPVRGTKPRGGIDQVFQRQSLETNRSSFDVEKGAGSPIPMTGLVKEGPSNRSDGPIPVVPHSPAGTSGPDTHRRSYVGPRRAMSPNSPPHAASGFSHSSISRPAHMSQPSSRHLFYPRSITPHGHPPEAKMPTRPVLDSKTGRPVRNYSRHPGANVFCFNGRMLTGGDSPLPFIGTLIFVFGLAGVWFGCVAPWWWHHVSPAVPVIAGYLTLVSISSLVITATKDPGILPRNLDPDPPYTTSSQVSENTPAVPMPRDIQVRAGIARVKWCQTCRMYRPPRSSHCKMCDNCVDGCDHHCQWVNNCVGRRNYTHFFTLIIAMSVTDIYIVVTSALQLYFLSKWDHLRFRRVLSHAPGTAVAFSMSVVAAWPVLALLFYHVRLVFLNITTIEQVRSKAHAFVTPGEAPRNPFTLGSWRRNVAWVFCHPSGFSWIEPSAYAEEDSRVVNPGSLPGWRYPEKEIDETNETEESNIVDGRGPRVDTYV